MVLMNAHFFDLNTLITINSRVWVVENTNPNKPIIRITKSEFLCYILYCKNNFYCYYK